MIAPRRAPRQGGQRQRAAAARARALRAAAERGLRAARRGDARAVAGARGRPRAPRARARSCCAPTAPRSRPRGASPARRRALAGALFLHRLLTVQSRGERTRDGRLVPVARRCSCAARPPAQVGYLDPDFFVYSDEVDFARRLRDAGWHSVYVPAARAVHHEQLSTGAVAGAADRRAGAQPRPVHAQAPLRRRGARRALADRLRLRRARARRAACCPGHDAAALLAPRHARRLHPERGEGLREAAERYNRGVTERLRCRAAGPRRRPRRSPWPARNAATRRRAVGHERAAPRRARAGGRSASASSAAGHQREPGDAREQAGGAVVGQQQLAGHGDRRRGSPTSCARRRHSKPTAEQARA